MKAIVFILAVVAMPALAAPPPPPPATIFAAPAASNRPPVVLFQGTNSLSHRPYTYWVLTNMPNAQVARKAAPAALAPGVYETAPYTCIVVVPKEHPDKIDSARPAPQVPEMPTVRPELQFIPRKPAGK